jgi:6-pyruvoyltetrahydropterin/6-carboxytetrahydropterin synthase
MRVRVTFEFSASHQLPKSNGPCRELHGHNYVLEVELSGPMDPATGMVMDFDEVDRVVQARLLSVVDHRHLNNFLETPTAEALLAWFWRMLRPHLPHLAVLRLHETRRYVAEFEATDADAAPVQYAAGYDGPA